MTSAGIVGLLTIASSLYLFFSVREVVGNLFERNARIPLTPFDYLDVIPTSETSYYKGFKMIIRYKPFLILTGATVASILATQVPSLAPSRREHLARAHF